MTNQAVEKPPIKPPKRPKKKGFLYELNKNRSLLIMLMPAVAFVLVFNYAPMAGVWTAFTHFRIADGIFRSRFVGLANFDFFFRSGEALRLTAMTVGYNLAFIITGLFWAVSLALVLSELRSKMFKKVSHSIIFLPHFISWVVIAFMAFNLFNTRFGVINSIRADFGREAIEFYSSPNIWRFLIVAFSNWRGVGFGSIIYLAVLTGISPEYYESAKVDGATLWQRMRYISIPFLKPTIGILMLMAVAGVFRGGGDMFFQLIQRNPMLTRHVDVIDAYLIRVLTNPIGIVNFSMLTAVGLFQQASGFILIMLVNGFVRWRNSDNALF